MPPSGLAGKIPAAILGGGVADLVGIGRSVDGVPDKTRPPLSCYGGLAFRPPVLASATESAIRPVPETRERGSPLRIRQRLSRQLAVIARRLPLSTFGRPIRRDP